MSHRLLVDRGARENDPRLRVVLARLAKVKARLAELPITRRPELLAAYQEAMEAGDRQRRGHRSPPRPRWVDREGRDRQGRRCALPPPLAARRVPAALDVPPLARPPARPPAVATPATTPAVATPTNLQNPR